MHDMVTFIGIWNKRFWCYFNLKWYRYYRSIVAF